MNCCLCSEKKYKHFCHNCVIKKYANKHHSTLNFSPSFPILINYLPILYSAEPILKMTYAETQKSINQLKTQSNNRLKDLPSANQALKVRIEQKRQLIAQLKLKLQRTQTNLQKRCSDL